MNSMKQTVVLADSGVAVDKLPIIAVDVDFDEPMSPYTIIVNI